MFKILYIFILNILLNTGISFSSDLEFSHLFNTKPNKYSVNHRNLYEKLLEKDSITGKPVMNQKLQYQSYYSAKNKNIHITIQIDPNTQVDDHTYCASFKLTAHPTIGNIFSYVKSKLMDHAQIEYELSPDEQEDIFVYHTILKFMKSNKDVIQINETDNDFKTEVLKKLEILTRERFASDQSLIEFLDIFPENKPFDIEFFYPNHFTNKKRHKNNNDHEGIRKRLKTETGIEKIETNEISGEKLINCGALKISFSSKPKTKKYQQTIPKSTDLFFISLENWFWNSFMEDYKLIDEESGKNKHNHIYS